MARSTPVRLMNRKLPSQRFHPRLAPAVTDRYFYSYCRPELAFEPLSTFFNGKKAEIIALYEGFETLKEDRRNDVLKFYEEFWEMMEDEGRFERQILRNCQTW